MQEKNYDAQKPRISNQDHHSKTKDKSFIKKKKMTDLFCSTLRKLTNGFLFTSTVK